MKKRNILNRFILVLGTAVAVVSTPSTVQAANASTIPQRPLQAGFANFKNIVEQSKLGKKEQATFDGMKKQMESILGEKEKGLNEMAAKFNDTDFLDSLSPEAETELKRKFRAQSQEYSQQQNQYYQSLQQANYKILEKLADYVSKAAAEVAKENKLDVIYNQEGTFYHNSDFDVSSLIVAKLDALFDKENAANENQATEQPLNKEPVPVPAPVKKEEKKIEKKK
jgi:outer membrane protein